MIELPLGLSDKPIINYRVQYLPEPVSYNITISYLGKRVLLRSKTPNGDLLPKVRSAVVEKASPSHNCFVLGGHEFAEGAWYFATDFAVQEVLGDAE